MATEEEIQLAIDYEELFKSERGKRVLADLKKKLDPDMVLKPIDAVGRIDPYKVCINNGKRAAFIYIITMMNKEFDKPKQEKSVHETVL